MKKILAILLLVISLFLFTSCGKKDKIEETPNDKTVKSNTENKKNVVQVNKNTKNNTQEIQNQEKELKAILEKQKENLPKTLELLKDQNDCLQKAETKDDALACGEQAKEKAKELGLTDVIVNNEQEEEMKKNLKWDKQEKEKTLQELNLAVIQMEKALPCTQKANSLEELGNCFNVEK